MALVVGLGIPLLYLVGPLGEGDIVALCVGGAVGLTWLLGLFLSAAVERSEVRASPRGLRVTRRGLLRSHTTAIAADQLRDLEVVAEVGTGSEARRRFSRGPAIVARSDSESVTFGAGLSSEELAWIKAVIESVVTA